MKMKTLLLLFVLVASFSFSQEKESSQFDNQKIKLANSEENPFIQKYNSLLSQVKSKEKGSSIVSKDEPGITYVSPPTYTTFLGFVTMTYTVCYVNAPCSIEGGTWWCGCSEYN